MRHLNSAASIVASPLHGDLLVSADLTADEISATGGHRRFVPAPGPAWALDPFRRCLGKRRTNKLRLRLEGRRASFRARESQEASRKMNTFIFRLASGFPLPGNSPGVFSRFWRRLLGSFYLNHRRNGSRAQAGPGAGFQGPHRPLTFFLLILFHPLQQSAQMRIRMNFPGVMGARGKKFMNRSYFCHGRDSF